MPPERPTEFACARCSHVMATRAMEPTCTLCGTSHEWSEAKSQFVPLTKRRTIEIEWLILLLFGLMLFGWWRGGWFQTLGNLAGAAGLGLHSFISWQRGVVSLWWLPGRTGTHVRIHRDQHEWLFFFAFIFESVITAVLIILAIVTI